MKAFLPFIIIAVSIAAYFLYISPSIERVQALGVKKDEYQMVLNKVKEIKETRDSILAEYNSIPKEDIDRLTKVIPENFNSTHFVNDLNNIASRNGLAVKTFKVTTSGPATSVNAEEVSAELYKTNVINLSLSGQYGQFVSFLADVEKNLQLMDIKTLNIASQGGSKGGEDQFNYTLEVNTYSLK